MADYDLVIRGGTIADGTGGDLVEGDVAIAGGRIAALGSISGNGAQEIDAKNKIVTPGFIDVHTHYDGQCIWAEELSPSSSHGVTTAVMGNCGVGTFQVMPSPIGLIAGLELRVHPFVLCPSWAKIAHLSIPEQVAAMRDPSLRAARLSEDFTPGHPFNELARNWRWLFPLDNPPDYAPPAHMSMAGQAAARGCSPQEIAYDRLLETEGRGLFLAALGNYENASLASAHEMLRHPYCVPASAMAGRITGRSAMRAIRPIC